MDAAAWDERYRGSELVWKSDPNRWVADEVADLPPGRAIDLAAGEGRNAIWLAGLGWSVTAVDFSGVGLDKGRAVAPEVDWVQADLLSYVPEPAAYELVLIAYLHLIPPDRRVVARRAAAAVATGGTLLIVAHDRANLERGIGGPQDPDLLPTGEDLRTDLADCGLVIHSAGERLRPVEGQARAAVDVVLRASRLPASGRVVA